MILGLLEMLHWIHTDLTSMATSPLPIGTMIFYTKSLKSICLSSHKGLNIFIVFCGMTYFGHNLGYAVKEHANNVILSWHVHRTSCLWSMDKPMDDIKAELYILDRYETAKGHMGLWRYLVNDNNVTFIVLRYCQEWVSESERECTNSSWL